MRIIYRLNGEAISLDVQRTIDGITYPNLKGVWESIGVTKHEVEDYPDSETHTWTENLDGTLNIFPIDDNTLLEKELLRSSQTAQRYLNDTDYLFAVDRHAKLSVEEPVRANELVLKREEAREIIRKYKEVIGDKYA